MPSALQHSGSPHGARTPSPPPEYTLSESVVASPTRLSRVACNIERQRNDLDEKVKLLQRKLERERPSDDEDIDSGDIVPTRKRHRNSSLQGDNHTAILLLQSQAADAGCKFVLVNGLWLLAESETFRTPYDPKALKKERFENNDNKIQGQVWEVREVLGKHSKDLVDSMSSEPYIAKEFVEAMSAQRSSTANRLRRQCPTIFDVSQSDLLEAHVRRDKFQTRIGWTQNGNGSHSYSSIDVEILHKDYSRSFDYYKIFLSPYLMRVYVALIRGPTAAFEFMNGTVSYPKTDCMARIHGIKHTTAGAIASCAILARWTLSSDSCLQKVGDDTHINYQRDFEQYLEFLLTGLRKKKSTILNIFAEWDRAIFPHTDSSLALRHPNVDDGIGLRKMLTMMEADDVEGSSGEEED